MGKALAAINFIVLQKACPTVARSAQRPQHTDRRAPVLPIQWRLLPCLALPCLLTMYLPPHFGSTDPAHARALVRAHPLASLVSTDDGGFPFVTHLPLLGQRLAQDQRRRARPLAGAPVGQGADGRPRTGLCRAVARWTRALHAACWPASPPLNCA